MTRDRTSLPSGNVTALIGAKTITSAEAYRHGVVTVVQLGFSDASSTYIKVLSNGGLEIGGTSEAGTGTKVTW